MKTEDIQLIQQYLSDNQPFTYKDTPRHSTIVAGLRECRLFTKRGSQTGNYEPDAEFGFVGHWLGAIGYFTILDQIGSCYKLPGQAVPVLYNSIQFAIENLGYDLLDNDTAKLNSLIALRNAFTHDFNLLNIPRDANKIALQQHKFTVNSAPDSERTIVTLPTTQWDGNIPDKNFYRTDDTTFVNLFGFGSFVEEIFRRLKDRVDRNEIDTIVDTHTLINKYTFVTSEHIIKNAH